MKSICRKTGITLISSAGFSRWATVEQHPIFTISLERLVTLAATEWSPALPEQEKKLLLLAIASSCDLLQWSEKEDEASPAMPSLSIVESSIADLLKIAGWIDAERYANRWLHYPSYHITTVTASMATFPDMLSRIITTRKLTLAAEKREHRLTVLEHAAINLSARCRIGDSKKESALLRVTAEWAMMVTAKELRMERVSAEIREDWMQMLQTSPSKLKASKFSITDVEELRDFMLDYLPHGSIIAHDVIAHCNRLISCNVINDIDHGDIMAARVLMDAALDSGVTADSDPAPMRAAYGDLLSYARDKAAWQLRNIHREQQSATALKLAAIQARREKDAGSNAETEGDEI